MDRFGESNYRDGGDDEGLTEEVEALKAIFMEEVEVNYNDQGRPVEIVTTLHPATAEDTEHQFVRVTLVVILPPNYPDCSPEVQIRNPRGLSDEQLGKMRKVCKTKCEDYQGTAVIYELIETVKEVLTSSNTPTGQCPICLCDFMDGDAVSKTECYHHFHCYCLGTYVQKCLEEHKQKQAELPPWQQKLDVKIICPVCREPVLVDLQSLLAAPLPQEESSSAFSPTDELKELRQKMADLYVKQKEKGGIIDLKEEENRFLLFTGEVEEPRNEDMPPPFQPTDTPEDSRHPNPFMSAMEFSRPGPKLKLPPAFTSLNTLHTYEGWHGSSQNGSDIASKPSSQPMISEAESLETGVGNSHGGGRNSDGRSYGGRPKHGRCHDLASRRRPTPAAAGDEQKGGSSSNNGTATAQIPGPPPRPKNPPPHRSRRPPPGFSRKPPPSRSPPGFEAS